MRKGLWIVAGVLLGVAGCQKLNVEGETTVPLGIAKAVHFDAPAYKQEVRVDVKPEDVSVSAYLVKTSDAEAVENAAVPGKAPPKNLVLDGKTFKAKDSRQDFTLEATIPAKTPYSLIFVGGSKTTKVKYKVVGR